MFGKVFRIQVSVCLTFTISKIEDMLIDRGFVLIIERRPKMNFTNWTFCKGIQYQKRSLGFSRWSYCNLEVQHRFVLKALSSFKLIKIGSLRYSHSIALFLWACCYIVWTHQFNRDWPLQNVNRLKLKMVQSFESKSVKWKITLSSSMRNENPICS